jgi:TPR repeat protein
MLHETLQKAKAGDPRAMQHLGRWHATGEGGCALDPGWAAYWFFQAWQGGLDEAEADIIRIREPLEDAAAAGSPEAQNAMGLILCFGQDEPAAAAEWFARAGDQDHPEALRSLGNLFEAGRGVPKNDEVAADFYRKAAELGDPFAQFNFAIMMDRGRGVPRDAAAVREWLKRAADQGMQEAREALSELER